MIEIDKMLSNKIANVSFLCSLLIPALHVHVHFDLQTWSHYIHSRIVTGLLLNAAVPMFFLISGFLFAGRFDDQSWWRKLLAKRLVSLGVPYVFWNVLFYLFMAVVVFIGARYGVTYKGLDLISGSICGMRDVLGLLPIYLPALSLLWFVRCLIYFVLIAPLFMVFRYKFGGIIIVVSFFGQWLLGSSLSEIDWRKTFWLTSLVTGFTYFSCGVWLRYHAELFQGIGQRRLGWVFGILLALFLGLASKIPEVFLLPPVLLMIWMLTPSSEWPRWLTRCSFPIYLQHGFWLVFIVAGMKSMRLANDSWCSFLGQYVVVVFLSIVVTVTARRLLPRFCSIIFGGR